MVITFKQAIDHPKQSRIGEDMAKTILYAFN
jgi:hypothetical protein